jgi:hypothetical protein
MLKRSGSGKLRLRLIRDLVITIIITRSLILLISINYTIELHKSVSQMHIQQVTQTAVQQFNLATDPAERILRICKSMCAADLIVLNYR